jgi:membrane fusion protein, heavy metal efflux system
MNIRILRLLVASLLANSSLAVAATPLGCLIEPDQVANVGSQVIGVTEAIMVERGDYVKKGQVLATLKSDIERASVNVARTRAQLEADVRTAEANLNLARVTEKRGQELVEKKFLSQQALDKSHAETLVAQQRLAFAKEQLSVASGELGVAKAQLGMRAIRSPIDGIVSERFIWPGERVEEKPLFKIVKIHPLRVEVVVPVALYGKITNDDIITILPDMPNAQSIDAKVVLVDKIIDGASNTFRIRAEIPNEDMKIPSGLRCKATLPETFKSASFNNQLVAQAPTNLSTSQQPPSRAVSPVAKKAMPVPSSKQQPKSASSGMPILNAKLDAKNQPYKTLNDKTNSIASYWKTTFGPSTDTSNASQPSNVLSTPFASADATIKPAKLTQVAYGKIRTVAKQNVATVQTAAIIQPQAQHVQEPTPLEQFNASLTLDKKLSISLNTMGGTLNQVTPQQASKYY